MTNALVAMPGGWELFLIIFVIVLLFGAKKLPELARGSGRALRIFKAETKGLKDDDKDDEDETPAPPAAIPPVSQQLPTDPAPTETATSETDRQTDTRNG